MEPSREIDPKYVVHFVETKDGRLLQGMLVEKNATEVVLRDAKNQSIRIKNAEIERQAQQQKSLMPELLLRDMTAQQVADLLDFLGTLKKPD